MKFTEIVKNSLQIETVDLGHVSYGVSHHQAIKDLPMFNSIDLETILLMFRLLRYHKFMFLIYNDFNVKIQEAYYIVNTGTYFCLSY